LYQHKYCREDELNSLAHVVVELTIRITIVQDISAGMDIARTNLLMTTIRNHPKSIR
jgi:hypothetical protein